MGKVAKPTNIYWKKARIVLFILTPFVLIFEGITDDIDGVTLRIIATFFWFRISKEIFLHYDNKSIIQNYPKLSILAISVGVFIIFSIMDLTGALLPMTWD